MIFRLFSITYNMCILYCPTKPCLSNPCTSGSDKIDLMTGVIKAIHDVEDEEDVAVDEMDQLFLSFLDLIVSVIIFPLPTVVFVYL